MKQQIKLSIIIPAYDVEDYIEKCLDSIVSQNDEVIEVILVDDGSKDKTGELCDKYAEEHENIRVFHKKNSGQSDSRNLAIKNASGQYLMFIDSDDYIQPNTIHTILKKIEQNDEKDVIIGRYIDYDSQTKKLEENCPCFNSDEIEMLKGQELLQKLMSKGTYDWFPWLNIVRREYLLDNSLFFKSGAFFEDAMWVPDLLLKATKVGYIVFPFYVYVRNREGATTNLISPKVYADKIKACEYTQNFIHENNLDAETGKSVLGNINRIYVSLLADCWYFNKDKRDAYIKEIGKYKNILLYSRRKYLQILYYVQVICGLKLISYVLYLRAQWVRAKRKKQSS